jgi:plastocyanin
MRRYLAILATCIATLALLIGVDAVTGTAAAPPAPKIATIVISNFTYSGTLTVPPGARVRVENHDSFSHTLTNNGNKFDTGVIPAGKARAFIAPRKVGNFKFHCNIHSSMMGTLHVRA